MATIPPNWMSSIFGAQGAQHQGSAKKAKDAADQSQASERGSFSERLQNVIENSDRDGQVYEDAEGLGSQGRSFEESEEEPEQQEQDEAQNDEDAGGLDLQA